MLESLCAFSQYCYSSDDIPATDVPPDSLVSLLDRIASLFYYSDQGIEAYEALQCQAYTEIGYYWYDIMDFNPYPTVLNGPANRILGPRNVELKFNPNVMYTIYTWLRDHGNNILYIYGEYDRWGATAMERSGKTNPVKFVKADGSPRTRIANLPPDEMREAYSNLERWLEIPTAH